MDSTVNLLDIVALVEDFPESGLPRGQVGTVVEVLTPDTFLVEFSDDQGRTYAMVPLNVNQLIVLHFEPAEAELVGKL